MPNSESATQTVDSQSATERPLGELAKSQTACALWKFQVHRLLQIYRRLSDEHARLELTSAKLHRTLLLERQANQRRAMEHQCGTPTNQTPGTDCACRARLRREINAPAVVAPAERGLDSPNPLVRALVARFNKLGTSTEKRFDLLKASQQSLLAEIEQLKTDAKNNAVKIGYLKVRIDWQNRKITRLQETKNSLLAFAMEQDRAAERTESERPRGGTAWKARGDPTTEAGNEDGQQDEGQDQNETDDEQLRLNDYPVSTWSKSALRRREQERGQEPDDLGSCC